MLKTDRNTLLKLVRDADIPPETFTVTHKEEEPYVGLMRDVFRLRVSETDLMFAVYSRFEEERREYILQYSNFKIPNHFGNLSSWTGVGSFSNVQQTFTTWLTGPVRKYLAHRAEKLEDQVTPDDWAELSRATPNANELPNTRFTTEEQVRIENELRQFEQTVETQNLLSEEQTKLLHKEIEHLIATSKHFGRKDWLNMAGGALMGYTVQAGLNSETTLQLLRLGGQALRWIVQTPFLLPG